MPWKRRLYNFVTDDVHLTADGEHGLVVAHDCFGALPGDGVDIHFHLLIPDGTHVTFHAGTDYTQSRLTVRATGPSAAHAVAVTASALEQVRDTARGGG